MAVAAAIPAWGYIAGLAVSAGAAGYGAYQQNQIAKFNEGMADRDAIYQEQKAAFESRQRRKEGQRVLAQQKVGYAKAGVSLLSDSAQGTFGDTFEEMATDMMAIKYGGDVAALKSKTAAANYASEGRAATVSGIGSVGSSLMSSRYALGR